MDNMKCSLTDTIKLQQDLTHSESSDGHFSDKIENFTPSPNIEFKCHICGKYTKTKFTRDRHVLMVHEKPNLKKNSVIACEICHKTFFKQSNLKRHLNTVHKKGRVG